MDCCVILNIMHQSMLGPTLGRADKPGAFDIFNIFVSIGPAVKQHFVTEYYTEVHLLCFLRKRYSSRFVTQQVP
jgi:hypothetical protein